MAIQPHSRIESQLTDPTYNGPYLSRIELILKDMLENYGRIALVGPYDSLEDLPETGQAGYVYLVRVEGSNLCDEYIWDEQEEEYNYVGRFEIDLADYQTKDLSNPITIDSVVYTTVESALAAMNVSLSNVSRDALKKVSTMPQNPSNNDLVVWQGNNAYKVGHTYKYVEGTGETLYAWQVDNSGGIGDGTVIYTKSAIPNEDTNIYKSDGTAYSSSTDDPTYELMVGGESAITIEIFSLSQMQSWERGALRKTSEDIVATSGEWVEVAKDNIQDDWEQSDSSAPDYIKNKPTLGTAASRNATNQITAGSTALPEAGAVKTALDGKISTSNTPGHVMNDGTIDTNTYEESGVAETLVKDTVGWSGKNKAKDYTVNPSTEQYASILYADIDFEPSTTYTISFEGTGGNGLYTNEDLVENSEMFTVASSGRTSVTFTTKSTLPTPSADGYLILKNSVSQSAANVFTDLMIELGSSATSYEPYHATVDTVKADKVTNATSGHLAGLDSNGNLTDSGVSPTEDVTVEGNPVTFESPFEQDAKSVVVSVKPIQDLHGYDAPWVGGASANVLNPYDGAGERNSVTWTPIVDTDNNKLGYTVNGTPSGYTSVIPFSLPIVNADKTYNIQYFDFGSPQGVAQFGWDETAGAQLADISSGTIVVPANHKVYIGIYINLNQAVSNLKLQVMVSESVITDFAPYSNECPISGTNEVEIGVSGKNQFDEDGANWKYGYYIDENGNEVSNNNYKYSQSYIVVGNASYSLSFDKTSSYQETTFLSLYDSSKRFIGFEIVIGGTSSQGRVFGNITFNSNVSYIRINILKSGASNIQLELGSTPTDYEPYTGHTTTIPLPSTLYDADVDVTNGDATEEYGMVTDDGISNISTGTSSGGMYWSEVLVSANAKIGGNAISSHLPYVSDGNIAWIMQEPCFTVNADGGIRIYTDESTVEGLKARLANLQVCYELATPTTLSLTPTDVELLEGTNVVSTNAEKVAVTYKAGILATLGDIDDLNDKVKTKFDKKDVATIETGSTASKTYYKGDYIVRSDGCLYDVTATIASGAAFTNNNTHKTNIGDELNKFKVYISTSNSPVNGNDVSSVSISGYLPISPLQVFSWTGSGTVSITPKSSGGTWSVSGDVSNVRYGQIFMRT